MTDVARDGRTGYRGPHERCRAPASAKRYAAERRFKLPRSGGGADRDGRAAPAARHHLRPGHSGIHAVSHAVLPSISAARISTSGPGQVEFRRARQQGHRRGLPFAEGRSEKRMARSILSEGAEVILREEVLADPSLVGGTHTFALPRLRHSGPLSEGHVRRRRSCRSPAPPSVRRRPARLPSRSPRRWHPDPPGGAGGSQARAPDGSVALGPDAPSHLLYLNGGVVKVTAVIPQGVTGEVSPP